LGYHAPGKNWEVCVIENKSMRRALIGGLILSELGVLALGLTTLLVCFPLLPDTSGKVQTLTLLASPWLLLVLSQTRFRRVSLPHADWQRTCQLTSYWMLGLLVATMAASFLPVRGLPLLWMPLLFAFPLLLLADQTRALIVVGGLADKHTVARQLAVSVLLVQAPTGIIWILICLVALFVGGRDFLQTIPAWLRALLVIQLLFELTLVLRATACARRALVQTPELPPAADQTS
jgi:hypothetical protein